MNIIFGMAAILAILILWGKRSFRSPPPSAVIVQARRRPSRAPSQLMLSKESQAELDEHLGKFLQKFLGVGSDNISLTALNLAAGEAKIKLPSVSGRMNREGASLKKAFEMHVGDQLMRFEIAPAPVRAGSENEMSNLSVVDFYYQSEWLLRSLIVEKSDGSVEIRKTLHCERPDIVSMLLWGIHGRLV